MGFLSKLFSQNHSKKEYNNVCFIYGHDKSEIKLLYNSVKANRDIELLKRVETADDLLKLGINPKSIFNRCMLFYYPIYSSHIKQRNWAKSFEKFLNDNSIRPGAIDFTFIVGTKEPGITASLKWESVEASHCFTIAHHLELSHRRLLV